MKINVGDLVKLRNNLYYGNLVGMIVGKGEEERRVYGDGYATTDYVEVQWFSKKHGSVTARFSPAHTHIEVISCAGSSDTTKILDLL